MADELNWQKAEEKLHVTLENYKELIGVPGVNVMFALNLVILPLKARFDQGERTPELYAEIMALE